MARFYAITNNNHKRKSGAQKKRGKKEWSAEVGFIKMSQVTIIEVILSSQVTSDLDITLITTT